MKRLANIVLTTAWLLLAAAPCVGQETEVPPTRSWEYYQVIVQRNIFSRHRVPVTVSSDPSDPTTTGSDTAPPTAAAQEATARASYALVGVAIEEDRRIAFFENPLTQETIKSAVGDELLGGLITAITIDGIEYELDGQTITVPPGNTLTGQAAPTPAAPGPAPSEGEGYDGSNSSIIEQMRLRRQQELDQ